MTMSESNLAEKLASCKTQLGRLATFEWIGCCIWHIYASNSISLSIYSASVIIIGMFISAVVFGVIMYIPRRIGINIILRMKGDKSDNIKYYGMKCVSFIVDVISFLCIYNATKFALLYRI